MHRMFCLYLLSFAGAFRSGMNQLWNIEFSGMLAALSPGYIR